MFPLPLGVEKLSVSNFSFYFYNADDYFFILPKHLIFPICYQSWQRVLLDVSFWRFTECTTSQDTVLIAVGYDSMLDICTFEIVLQSADPNALSLWSFHHCWANRHPNQYSKEGDVDSTALKKRQKTVEEWEMEQFSLKFRTPENGIQDNFLGCIQTKSGIMAFSHRVVWRWRSFSPWPVCATSCWEL